MNAWLILRGRGVGCKEADGNQSNRKESSWSSCLRLAGPSHLYQSPLSVLSMPSFLSYLLPGLWCGVVPCRTRRSCPPGGTAWLRDRARWAPARRGTDPGVGAKRGSEGVRGTLPPQGPVPFPPSEYGCPEHPATLRCPSLARPTRGDRSGLGWVGETRELPKRGARQGEGRRPQVPWPQAPRCRTMTGGWCSLSERRLAARSWHKLA